jgi:hypothetical protein
MEKLLLGVGALISFVLLFIYLVRAEEKLPPQNGRVPVKEQKPKKKSLTK